MNSCHAIPRVAERGRAPFTGRWGWSGAGASSVGAIVGIRPVAGHRFHAIQHRAGEELDNRSPLFVRKRSRF